MNDKENKSKCKKCGAIIFLPHWVSDDEVKRSVTCEKCVMK